MRYRHNTNSPIIFVIVMVVLFTAAIGGWGANIYKLTQCDFKSPYKCEVLRIVGIPVGPLGAVLGYIDIDDT